jgi:hypothetical protein
MAGDGMAALVEKTRQILRVTAQATPANSEVRVAITCAAGDSRAVAVVNSLARHYGDQCHTKLETDAQQAVDAARAAHREACQRALTAKAAVDGYLRDAARKSSSAEDLPTPGDGVPNRIPAAGSSQSDLETVPRSVAAGRELRLTTNPEWTRLSEELQSLQNRRTQLSAIRTPAHPEMQEIERRIAQTEERLAVTRRQIVAQPAELPVVINGSLPPPLYRPIAAVNEERVAPQRPAENPTTTEVYRKLNDALNCANAAVERLAAAEAQARRDQDQLPLIEVFDAKVTASSVPRLQDLLQPLRLSLAAGLAMAIGTGLLLWGIPRARTFACSAQLQDVLSLPVVGVLHEAGVAAVGGRSALRRVTSLLCLLLGMAIVGGCGLVLTGQIDHLASYVPYDLHSITDPLHRFVDILSQKP